MDKEELKRMSEKELTEQLGYLKKRLLTLEWDKSQNQLNIGMEPMLESMKKELGEIQQRLDETKKTENITKNAEASEETESKTEETAEEAPEELTETKEITKEIP